MHTGSLRSEFEQAQSVLQLAARLGRICLGSAYELETLNADPVIKPFRKQLERVVLAIDQELWLQPHAEQGLAPLLEVDELGRIIDFVETHSPIDCFAVLRGLLPMVRRVFDEATGEIEVEPGMPLPVTTRRVNDLFETTTPSSDTMRLNNLLRLGESEDADDDEDLAAGIYLPDLGLDNRLPIVLDFTHRESLDELTWIEVEPEPGSDVPSWRLPRIGTLHPLLGRDGIVVGETTDSTFFDVRPRHWDCDEVAAQLRGLKGEVEIAVLPELSLPEVDALEDALEREAAAFPPLIVAGSAHLTETGEDGQPVCANESRIYLDGQRIGAHRKIRPFVLRKLEGKDLPRPLQEGITKERRPVTVLAGDCTRLAVVICADIIHERLPHLLEQVGVNLLLVPALTVEPGSFNGDVCRIAARVQGVTVIVNGDGTALIEDEEVPFMVIAGVPRPRVGDQSREYERPTGTDPPYTGLFDPNLPLRAPKSEKEAFEWR